MEETSCEYNLIVDTQKNYDRIHFTQWCYNLFELNERLHTEMSLTNRLYVNDNGYLLRSYFVVLWEIIYNGKNYLERHDFKDEKHLLTIKKLIDELLDNISEDDYFMINYYRNCASHIFLTKYSVLDENDNPKKEEDCKTRFYNKSGQHYYNTYDEIMKKVENVFGDLIGVANEPIYQRKLINRLYPIIHKYCVQIGALDEEKDNAFYKELFPYIKGINVVIPK